jgi:hypothetical protein
MVRDTILKQFKRIIIPFGVVSTSFLMFNFNSAKASTLSDTIFQKRGVLTHDYSGGESGFSLLELPKTAIHNIDVITGYIMKGLDWLNNLDGSIPKLTADLLTAIYHFLAKIILTTPLMIFNNPYLQNASLTFAVISITIVTILTVIESLMQIINKKHTDFKTIMKRWSIVACVSGFLPFAFESGFGFLNKLSEAISKIGVINGGSANGFINGVNMGFFDTFIIILFDLTAIAMLVPVCLQAAKRWFDLTILACISPLALSTWIFDRHQHFFSKWWSKVKALSLVQLVYAVFILIMGILIFSTQSIQGGIFALTVKTLLVIGGLSRMANAPQFVTSMTGDKSDLFDEYDKGKNTFRDIYDTVTFKNFRPVQFIKNQLDIRKQKQAEALKEQKKPVDYKYFRKD